MWILREQFSSLFLLASFSAQIKMDKAVTHFLSEMIKWRRSKARQDIVVLSQSAKHYSFSGSQTEYFMARKRTNFMFVIFIILLDVSLVLLIG